MADDTCAAASRVPAPRSLGAGLFVWGIWVLMTLAAVALVRLYGHNVPWWDEYTGIVPVLTGDEPLTIDFLWRQHNEHRMPIAKFLVWAMYRLSHGDLRTVYYLNVAFLSALAAVLIATAQRVRGSLSYLDAFFPLAVLHWGHWKDILMAALINFVLAALLCGVVLAIILHNRKRLTIGAALAAGSCLLGLALCGANGLALVPALGAWLLYEAIRRARSPGIRDWRAVGAIALSGLVPLLMIGVYFRGYQPAPYHAPAPKTKAALVVAGEFITVGFGRAAVPYWPYPTLAVVGLAAVAAICLLHVWWRRAEERSGAAGLLAFFGGVTTLAVGFGWGRAGVSDSQGFGPHYVTLSVPILCALYLAWDFYGPRALGQFVPACLFMATCVWFLPNFEQGRTLSQWLSTNMAGVEMDLRAGLPVAEVTRRWADFLFPDQQQLLANRFEMLHRAGMGKFRYLKDERTALATPAGK